MHDMWNKLFAKVVFYEPDCINVGRMLDEEVNAIVEPLKESIGGITGKCNEQRACASYLHRTAKRKI